MMFLKDLNLMAILVICFTIICGDDVPSGEQPHEIQKAECSITAGDVRASAEAITTKTLKGVCGSAEMNLALHNLEMKLYGELQEIKKLLTQLKSGNIEYSETATTTRSFIDVDVTLTTQQSPTIKPIQLKALHGKEQHEKEVESREWEVRKLNNTLLTDGKDTRIFSYYWKLENFSSKISNSDEQDEESYIFTILGKPLRIRASFNHMKRNFLYLKLESAKFDLRDRFQSIVMDMSNGGGGGGGSRTTIFKEIREAFHFIHKISILDQENSKNDLISQELTNIDKGFFVPNTALLNTPFTKNNTLLVKIFFYI